jgi:hypothetical protein
MWSNAVKMGLKVERVKRLKGAEVLRLQSTKVYNSLEENSTSEEAQLKSA